MIESNLILALSKEIGFPVNRAAETVKTIFNSMADALANRERVEIRDFGSFKIKHYDGYTGRNPKTGESINVKPKRMPFFKCGKGLKERVDIE